MNDDRLFRDLRALDRSVAVDRDFAERLYERLRAERRPRRRRWPLVLLAAAIAVGGSGAAVLIGGGSPAPDDDPTSVSQERMLSAAGGQIRVEYAVPSDLDLIVTEAATYLAFTGGSDVAYPLDGETLSISTGARGVKIVDVTGATAHYSNGRPVGVDAASFLDGLSGHPVLDLEVGGTTQVALGARSALAADVRSNDLPSHLARGTQAHLDQGEIAIDIWVPSRLIVADVGRAIVLIQIWAGSEEELAGWLEESEPFVSSVRLDEGSATEDPSRP